MKKSNKEYLDIILTKFNWSNLEIVGEIWNTCKSYLIYLRLTWHVWPPAQTHSLPLDVI